MLLLFRCAHEVPGRHRAYECAFDSGDTRSSGDAFAGCWELVEYALLSRHAYSGVDIVLSIGVTVALDTEHRYGVVSCCTIVDRVAVGVDIRGLSGFCVEDWTDG